MRVTYAVTVDAAYVHLTSDPLKVGRESVPCALPGGEAGTVVLDWKDGRIVGLEVQEASKLLHPDLLAEAKK